VSDAIGQALAYVYFEDEPGRRTVVLLAVLLVAAYFSQPVP